MAQLSLGESKWRMLRRVLGKKKFRYEDARNMTRHDQTHFDWLVEHGFFTGVADDSYGVTDKGREAADLGMYEYQSGSFPRVEPTAAKGGKK